MEGIDNPDSFNRKPKTENRKPHIVPWWMLLIPLILLAACGDKNTYVPPPPPKVTVSQPLFRPVTDYLEFTGDTQAINTVKLRARVEGFLEKVLFQDGSLVKKGQLLFVIQQNTYQAKLQQAEAELLANKAKYEHAKTEFARFTRLFKQKAAAETDVDRWHYDRDAYRAAVLASEASVELAKLNLSYTKVMAPFDGRINRRLKDPGNLVGTGDETVLAEINQIDPIYAYFTISELELLRARGENTQGEPKKHPDWPVFLGLANETGYPHQGKLDFAAISLTPTTGTLLLRGIFPNSNFKILPGMFARIRVPVEDKAKAMLLVPQLAVGYDQLGSYVLVVDEKNVVERRPVKLGPKVNDSQVIDEGLKGKEWIIVNGLLQAIPGRQVTPVKEEAPASVPGQATGSQTADQGKVKP
jgi:RND family efflux transporter MFP subunit